MNFDLAKFGTIYTFVDFGNVNKWFDKDVWDTNGEKLTSTEKLIVDIEKLANFINQFSVRKFFYYGFDQKRRNSLYIQNLARNKGFKTITKPIQWIKNRYEDTLIPKCNFDVEICLDIVRLIHRYDTICIFTSDNDFCALLEYIHKIGRKIILISRRPIRRSLKEQANIFINANEIKKFICKKKDLAVARSGNRARILESGSETTT